ncbi:helix-turn-helix domain-containing protein [Vibrio ishigakensis]|uniref:helix-turn-helix domain-containing protein n=1 Tax=Vibrio ishigakensis TaxID=1481914 RepID=UPI0021C39C2B|nr:helix-turn-helix domain-containing protein [Vibrio ishigakensis]
MSKYSREFKLSVAKQCSDGISYRALAKIFNVNSRQIRYWTRVYEENGEQAFLHKHLTTAKAKFDALCLMWENNWSINKTSAVLNLSTPSALSKWLHQYQDSGVVGLEPRSRGRATMKSKSHTTNKPDDEMTLEELLYLRAENAVLKKLKELRLEKEEQTKKKR